MDTIKIEYSKCPVCSSEERFFGKLTEEAIKIGYARPEWKIFLNYIKGIAVDETKKDSIPEGAKIPGFMVATDICLNCGVVYAVKVIAEDATVSTVARQPKLIVPGILPHQPLGKNNLKFS